MKQHKLPRIIISRRIFLIVGMGMVVIFIYLMALIAGRLHHPFEVDFLDVGQGDSTLIQISGQTQILVDGGPDTTVLRELGKTLPFYDRTLEMIILSHPDKDHLNGLRAVVERYEVKKIIMGNLPVKVMQTPEFIDWLNLLREKQIQVTYVKQGDAIVINEEIKGEIVWPKTDFTGSDINDWSVIFRLQYKNLCMFFPGDAGESVQKQLLLSYDISKCQILKVPHHGSKTALDGDFINLLQPESAIISVGKNSYGHPSGEIINWLTEAGIKIFRTDENGIIKVKSDGESYWLN